MKKLKNIYFLFLSLGIACVPLTGCTDYLDKAPESEAFG